MSPPKSESLLTQLKGLTGHTLTFGLGNLASQLVSLILLPVFTRIFTTEDYGIIGLMEVTRTLLTYAVALGIGPAINRFYFDSQSQSERASLVVTGFITQQLFAIPLCVGIWFMADWVAVVALSSPEHGDYARYMAAMTWGELTLMFTNNLFRVQLRSRLFTIISFVRMLVAVLLAILLVVVLGRGLLGALQASLIVTLAAAVIQLYIVRAEFKGVWSKKVLKQILHFGLPFVPHNLSGYMIVSVDRYFLAYLMIPEVTALRELGIYNVAFKFAMGMNLLLGALSQVWAPYIYAMNGKANQREVMGRLITYITLAMMTLAVTIAIFAPDALRMLTPEKFWGAAAPIIVLTLAQAFYGFYQLQGPTLGIVKKTELVPLVSAITLVVNAGLNIWWIPIWGIMGAAWATLVAYVVMAVLATYLGWEYYRMPLEIDRFLKLLIAAVIAVIVSIWVTHPDRWIQLAQHMVVWTLFPALLLLSGFLRQEERQFIAALWERTRTRIR